MVYIKLLNANDTFIAYDHTQQLIQIALVTSATALSFIHMNPASNASVGAEGWPKICLPHTVFMLV